jgi:AcrR family transcriptional regulator
MEQPTRRGNARARRITGLRGPGPLAVRLPRGRTGLSERIVTERRVVILRAARRLLLHYGPAKTTVADIAREAHVGVGSVYLEFTSKDAIVESLAEAQHVAVLEAERRAWAAGGDPRARLRAVLDARFAAFSELAASSAHARDLLLGDSPPIQRARARFQQAEEALFTEMVSQVGQVGALAAQPDPHLVARGLLRAYAAFAPPLLFREPLERLRRDLAVVHRLVLGE